jgi:hypothetical protein
LSLALVYLAPHFSSYLCTLCIASRAEALSRRMALRCLAPRAGALPLRFALNALLSVLGVPLHGALQCLASPALGHRPFALHLSPYSARWSLVFHSWCFSLVLRSARLANIAAKYRGPLAEVTPLHIVLE